MASSRREYEMLFRLNAQLGSNYSAAFTKAQAQISKTQQQIGSLGKLQADITAYQKQQNAMAATERKLETLRQQYDNIQREINETEGHSSALENRLLSKKLAIEQTTDALKQHTQKAELMGTALEKAGIDTKNLAGETDRLAGEIKALQNEQRGVTSSFDDGADRAKAFGHETVSAVESVQQVLVAAGIAKLLKEIGGAMVECTQASIAFESASTGIYKTVDGTDAELRAISKEIKQQSTEIPATTEEIAAVAEAAGQLGIATGDVMAFTRVMIDLGESTNLAADEAASSLAKFTNITKTSAENYSRLGSVVVDLGNNFATTEADIVAMATRLASGGRLAGLTEAEIMALATAMSSVGIEAEAGGTAMTQTFNSIEKAVANNGDDLEKYAQIAGMSAEGFASAWENRPIEAIQAFIAGLGKLDENGESAVLVLDELGLSGIRQSNMLKSLGLASDTLAGAVETANKAWTKNTALSEEAAKRYATTESKLSMLNNSYRNLQTAIGDVYTPALKNASEVGIEILDGMTEFVEKNPKVVKLLTSLTAGVVSAGVAIGGVALVTKLATPVMTAFNAVLAMNPVVLVTAGVVGLTTAIAAFAVMAEDSATPSVKELTEAAEQMDEAVTSAKEAYEDTAATTMATANVAQTYIDRLKELEAAGIDTDEEAKQYHNTLTMLCQVVPELSSHIDLETDTIKGGTAALEANTEAWKQNALQQAYQEHLTAVTKAYSDVLLEAEKNNIRLSQATAARKIAEQKVEDLETRLIVLLEEADKRAQHLAETEGYLGTGAELVAEEHARLSYELGQAQAEVAEATRTENAYRQAIAESADEVAAAEHEISLVGEAIGNLSDTASTATTDTAAATNTWKEASQAAFKAVQVEMEELIQEYNAAYAAALESFEGQFGLFDRASMESEEYLNATVANAQAALDSQLAYWESYSANIQTLQGVSATQLGITQENYDALLSYIQDGSQEAAGLAQSLVDNINSGNTDAVADLATTLGAVVSQREQVAATTTEWVTDFGGRMDELTKKMTQTVDGLELDDEAAAAAKSTIQAYADALLEHQDMAVDAATQIKNAVSVAFGATDATFLEQIKDRYNLLNPLAGTEYETIVRDIGRLGYNNSIFAGTIPGYAGGTNHAERGLHWVGENGPELVYFRGGETVLTAPQSAALMARNPVEALEIPGGGRAVTVQFQIQVEGDASERTVEALEAYSEEFAHRVRAVIAEAEYDHVRRRY